jgi:hypothetical protein
MLSRGLDPNSKGEMLPPIAVPGALSVKYLVPHLRHALLFRRWVVIAQRVQLCPPRLGHGRVHLGERIEEVPAYGGASALFSDRGGISSWAGIVSKEIGRPPAKP